MKDSAITGTRARVLAEINKARAANKKDEPQIADILVSAINALPTPSVEVGGTDVEAIVEAIGELRSDIVASNTRLVIALEKVAESIGKSSESVKAELSGLRESVSSLELTPSFDVAMPEIAHNVPRELEVDRDEFGRLIRVRAVDA